ncbi:hypothetical protein [Enterocloster lavalensis]
MTGTGNRDWGGGPRLERGSATGTKNRDWYGEPGLERGAADWYEEL